MDIKFDPAKDATNRDKHGVSLTFGKQVVDGQAVILPSIRPVDGETRYKAIGPINGKLPTVVFVYHGTAVRFISVSRSNDGERRLHDRA